MLTVMTCLLRATDPVPVGREDPWQTDNEFCEFSDVACDLDRAAVFFGDDFVADRQPKAGAFAGRLCGEEWLKELVPDLCGNAGAVVAHPDLDSLAEIAGGHGQ